MLLSALFFWNFRAIGQGPQKAGWFFYLAFFLSAAVGYFAYLTYQEASRFGQLAGAYLLYAMVGAFYWLRYYSNLSKREDRPSQQT